MISNWSFVEQYSSLVSQFPTVCISFDSPSASSIKRPCVRPPTRWIQRLDSLSVALSIQFSGVITIASFVIFISDGTNAPATVAAPAQATVETESVTDKKRAHPMQSPLPRVSVCVCVCSSRCMLHVDNQSIRQDLSSSSDYSFSSSYYDCCSFSSYKCSPIVAFIITLP